MGGIGSGQYYRGSCVMTTEEARRIDIRSLKKAGFLKAGASGVLRWSVGGEETGALRLACDTDHVRLSYRYREYGGEWREGEQRIQLTTTPCHYGGTRPWFVCNGCGRRAGVLYGVRQYFLCQYCCKLPYASQNEGQLDRMLRKARAIRKRLDASENLMEPIYEKPKGMHWKTFNRLVKEEEYWNASFDWALAASLQTDLKD